MDNFKAFQLTAEEAMNVTGQGRGHKGGKGGKRKEFLSGLSEADQTTIKTAVTDLKATAGWADLTRDEKRAGIKAIFEPYKA